MESLGDLTRFEALGADEVVGSLLAGAAAGRVCLTCSFQAEDVIVLDLLRKQLRDVPVLFLETGYHFRETYEFRDRLTREWQLNLVNVVSAPNRGGTGK